MKFPPQPCISPSESARLGAKQGHAKSTTFAKNFSDQTNNPSRLYPDSVGAWRPLRDPSPKPHATSATFAKVRSDLNNNPFRPWRPWREPSAFSLTEVVIAMGVAAVAFTSIIALFPLGLNMSKESYEDTQAALLAQTILADCRDNLTGSSATYSQTAGFLIQVSSLNSPINSSTSYTNVTNFPSAIYIAYKQESQTNGDSMLRPFTNSTSPGSFYTSGINGANAIAKIDFTFCFAGLAPNGSLTDGPKNATITIETPGDIPTVKRKQRIFSGGFQ